MSYYRVILHKFDPCPCGAPQRAYTHPRRGTLRRFTCDPLTCRIERSQVMSGPRAHGRAAHQVWEQAELDDSRTNKRQILGGAT